jgi:hypothetical protein
VSDGRNTQESLIEGIISGEADQETQDASIQREGSEDILIVVSIIYNCTVSNEHSTKSLR